MYIKKSTDNHSIDNHSIEKKNPETIHPIEPIERKPLNLNHASLRPPLARRERVQLLR
jgi:hypothetical protein